MVEDSGRFVSHCFDTIVALITTDAVAADSMTTASISSLEFPGPHFVGLRSIWDVPVHVTPLRPCQGVWKGYSTTV